MKKRTTTALAATITIAFALAGCTASFGDDGQGEHDVECTGLDEGYESCAVTLPDTRRVQCVYRKTGYSGGLDCDWAHVDGSDNL